MNKKLQDQPWVSAPAVKRLFLALGSPEVDVRLVGGCVRDGLLARSVHDIDIGTPESPETVIRRLKAHKIKSIPTGIDHGTITAVVDGEGFEITTLRRDAETDGRHAVVEYTDDWQEDAARRDFTINAMSARQNGTVFDYFGGCQDLAAGNIRFVGKATDRIREDILRILRFYRFQAHYGRGRANDAARTACRTHARQLSRLSAERIHHELIRLLEATNPAPALSMADRDGIWKSIFQNAVDVRSTARLIQFEKKMDRADPMRRLATLTEPLGDAAGVADRLKLSNAQRDRLVSAESCLSVFNPSAKPKQLRALLYRHGAEAVIDAALVFWAKSGRRFSTRLENILGLAVEWIPPKLPVDGADMIAKGLTTGPAIGASLKFIERWWIANDFQPGRDEAMAKLEEAIAFVRSLQEASR